MKYRIVTVFVSVLFLCFQVTASAVAKQEVSAVRIGLHADKTRFVLELKEKPETRIFFLSKPNRLVIDMPEVDWTAKSRKNRKTGLIENYRYGLFRQGTSRIVLDLSAPVKILRKVTLPPSEGKPYRFFIDIQRTNKESFQQAVLQSRKKQIKTTPSITLQAPKPSDDRKLTVVIDAGHGGIDPGAIGQSGFYEKIVTLAVAKKLHAKLKKNSKYHPVLTRSKDIFLSLRERVQFARNSEADLFISIHADSIGRPDIRGATVYTLSETASDDEAAALAKINNKSDVIAGVDLIEQDDTVQGILIDLAQRETMNFSVKFAKLLIPEFVRSGMRVGSRSHRFAGFRVLKAPDVPSVLVELGYLSNRKDEKILKSKSGQIKLANSIANAVDKYFSKH
ncbi:MAG: N-acetylmuramoyl-L-alanine amidase [Sneathiellales bacterium]|nr:N-acetylmuramoyl-L-alanine amidase [Sneathiellales bacterium]